jgi:hypothetical protein
MKTVSSHHHGRGVEQFLTEHGSNVTGVISGFDRLRLRASLRWLYQPSFMKRYLCEARVLLKDFGAYATGLSNRIRGDGKNVVKYLARYVSRTAISDERLVVATDESVTFSYVDSATKEPRECTLAADEFMRRYLMHVPPPGLHRVRYFGWMHPAAKRRRMIVANLLAVPIVVRPAPELPAWHLRCPHCQSFTLVCVGRIPRTPPACDR